MWRRAGSAVVAGRIFAVCGVFQSLAEQSATMFAPYPQYGAWIRRFHHCEERFALGPRSLCSRGSTRGGYALHDMGSTAQALYPHATIAATARETLRSHQPRRAAFAQGALEAAKWVHGKRGWFTIRDVLGDKS